MTQERKNSVLLITQEGMGSGPPDLQLRLLSVYLKLLLDNGLRSGAICFYTKGRETTRRRVIPSRFAKVTGEPRRAFDRLQNMLGLLRTKCRWV
jgi:hypothetical protein